MSFGGFVIYIFNLGVAIGAILAFIAIAYSGMKLLNAGGNPSSVSDAKKRIFNALLGLAVLLVSYLILTTINPDLVNIKDISLGVTQISIPILSPSNPQTSKPTLSFQEVPIGTITEGILAGNSSTRNELECFEYDDETGDIVDKNGDGKITEKDIVLDRDIFYCMKNLDEALRKKTEVEIPKLIKELNALMESCTCARVFVSYVPPAEIYYTGGECNCPGCRSFCKTCGHPHTGCTDAPGNTLEGEAELQQYNYDPCPNRKEIDCKREEIKQLMDGTDPEDICYEKGWIKDDSPKYPDMLTFKDGIERLNAFKDYFINEVDTLKQAEKSTKSPFGERLTLAEFYTIQNGDKDNVMVKSQYGNYNIYRYCDEYKYKCAGGNKENSDEDGECNEYVLNDQYRTCKKLGYEKFYYDGDPVTFYFSSDYYEQQQNKVKTAADEKQYNCSVYDKDSGGVIPIGETVDGTERYGLEVAERIGYLIENIQGVYNTTLSISNISETCDSANCVNSNTNCCYHPQCGCKGKCCCPNVSYVSCYGGIPSASLYSSFSNYSSGFPVTKAYTGCSSFCGGTTTTRQEESQKWACSYSNFCSLVRKIYQIKEMDSSCYDETDDEEEALLRERNMGIVGYLQKWKEREERLFELTEMKSLKKVKDIDVDSANDVINSVCASYLINPNEDTLSCDSDLSVINEIDSRSVLLEKLTTSRNKMTSCITGYSYPYKENLTQNFVFNCLEGISHQTVDNLVILPDFPYPSTKSAGYQNCYPYNDASLTDEQKNKCFQNIYRVGDASDPGCQTIVEEYMDNYYCCK